MYKKITFLLFVLAHFSIAYAKDQSWHQPRWVPDQLLVQFNEAVWQFPDDNRRIVSIQDLRNIDPEIGETFQKYGVYQVKLQFDVDHVLEESKNKYPVKRWEPLVKRLPTLRHRYLLYLDSAENLEPLKKALDESKKVKKISYNHYYYQQSVSRVEPDDPLLENQWGLYNASASDFDIDAEYAWDITTDASNILVGVIDGGFQEDHIDLAENVATTWDVVDDDSDPTSANASCNNHGTHVAGIIGAVGDNAEGISGVFWTGNLALYRSSNDDCLLSPETDSYYELATEKALEDGVDVINHSQLMCPDSNNDDDDPWITDVISSYQETILLINAAGNGGEDKVGDNLDSVDASSYYDVLCADGLDNILLVASSKSDGTKTSYSDFSPNRVHLAAPGGDYPGGDKIYSTIPTNSYGYLSGTSMAAPFVTGVAALAWSQCPDLSVQDIRQVILESVNVPVDEDGIPLWDGQTITEGIVDALDTVFNTLIACELDTDGDGAWDCYEISNGTDRYDPDTDDDGLNDGEEFNLGLDPQNPDTDGDGLNDGSEVNTYHTSPTDTDSDDDTISDGAEIDNGLDPTDPDDSSGDADGDGLTNAQEINTYGTAINNPDTDDDGLNDGSEVLTYGSNPLDTDSDDDSLSDGIEVNTYGTSPTDSDTDDDALDDGSEVLTHGTNPLDTDSDDDSLTDGSEVNTYGTNPLSPDTDADTLTDGEEVTIYHTNPLLADTDGDDLTDGQEVKTYFTDPLDPDTDDDRLTDGLEVLTYSTNPLDADSDNDIWLDGDEVYAFFPKDPLKIDNLVGNKRAHDITDRGYGNLFAYYPDGSFQIIGTRAISFIDFGTWISGIGDAYHVPLVGDFTGAGKTDVAAFNPRTGEIHVARSTGEDLEDKGIWISGFGIGSTRQVVGDFDGNNREDVAVQLENGGWRVALSYGSSFIDQGTWLTSFISREYHGSFGGSADEVLAGDFNGDGKDDLVAYTKESGNLEVVLSTGSNFKEPELWNDGIFTEEENRVFVEDFDDNGMDDIVIFNEAEGTWKGDLSVWDSFSFMGYIGDSFSTNSTQQAVGDFDGDCVTDIAVYTPDESFPEGTWELGFSDNIFSFNGPETWNISTGIIPPDLGCESGSSGPGLSGEIAPADPSMIADQYPR